MARTASTESLASFAKPPKYTCTRIATLKMTGSASDQPMKSDRRVMLGGGLSAPADQSALRVVADRRGEKAGQRASADDGE